MANSVVSSGSGEATGGLTDNEKMLSALGYVWLCGCLPLFLVPLFAAKESRFAQFHARQAAALYSRALELDNLAESLYRRLMTCYRELGEVAEALQVYRRCRDMLSIVLSASPSIETEAVRTTLRDAPPGEATR